MWLKNLYDDWTAADWAGGIAVVVIFGAIIAVLSRRGK